MLVGVPHDYWSVLATASVVEQKVLGAEVGTVDHDNRSRLGIFPDQ